MAYTEKWGINRRETPVKWGGLTRHKMAATEEDKSAKKTERGTTKQLSLPLR